MSNSSRLKPNQEWLRLVQTFKQHSGSSHLTSHTREELGQIVNEFYQTTQDLEMQSRLGDLHLQFNLTGLMAPEFVLNTLFLVNQARGSRVDAPVAPPSDTTASSDSQAFPSLPRVHTLRLRPRPSNSTTSATLRKLATPPASNEHNRDQLLLCHPT